MDSREAPWAQDHVSLEEKIVADILQAKPITGGSAIMDWRASSDSLPAIGDEVLVYKHSEDGDIYAVAHIGESQNGETYWDSDSDLVHGTPVVYVTHWCPLSPPNI